MLLSVAESQKIVCEMKGLIHHDINIMDETGIIIASTNLGRIGTLHIGASKLLAEQLPELVIHDSEIFPGAQEGVNLPITFEGDTLGVVGITGIPEEVVVYGNVIKKMTEIMLEQSALKERENDRVRARSLFLENWIFNDTFTGKDIQARGAFLGIDTTIKRVVGILQSMEEGGEAGKDAPKDLNIAEMVRTVRRYLSHFPQSFCFSLNEQVVLILPHKNSSFRSVRGMIYHILHEVESLLDMKICAGISGAPGEGKELKKCYEEAEIALKAALHHKQGTIITYGEISLEFIAQSMTDEVKLALTRMIFERMEEEEKEEIKETIFLFFKYKGDAADAAGELYVHKNTFLYRIQKVEKKTGLSLRDPKAAALLYMAAVVSD